MQIRKSLRILSIGLLIFPVIIGLRTPVARAAAPDTFILSGPEALTGETSATFEFESGDSPVTFECSLVSGDDTPVYTSCTSPYNAPELALGQYTFSVRARNAGDEVDGSPATRTWTIAAFKGGDGSEEDPFQIDTCDALQAMSLDLDASYELIEDVNCFGFDYEPVGTGDDRFTGSLDGNGFSVRFLTTEDTIAGIFGFTNGASIHDLGVRYGDFNGNDSGGGAVVGYADMGTDIADVHVYDTDVSSTNGYVGGVTGFLGNGSSMTRTSFVGGSVTSPDDVYIGGLTGTLAGSALTNSYSKTSLEGNQAGGLVGTAVGDAEATLIEKSYSASKFTALHSGNGGLVGLFESGSLSNSFSASDMRAGGGENVGALVGNVVSMVSENNYFDRTRAARANCAGSGDVDCTAVNVNNALPLYFKNNSTHDPLDTWDFGPEGTWHVNANDYPTLTPIYGPTIICEAGQQTLTSIHTACEYTEEGWGTTTWEGQYQVDGAADWTPITLDDVHVGEATVTGTSPYSAYNMRFRFTNDYGVSFWAVINIANDDSDDDGINDVVEDSGPNNGDANHDGTADKDQANITSIVNPVSDSYFVLKTACDNNFNVQIGGESDDPSDETFTYPAGLVGFVGRDCGEPGVTVPVTLYAFGDYDPEDFVLRKYFDGEYSTIEDATITATTIGDEKTLKVEYSVVDGGSLDADGAADGNISDPVGLADSTIDAPDTGLPQKNIGVSIALLIAGIAVAAFATKKVAFENITSTKEE